MCSSTPRERCEELTEVHCSPFSRYSNGPAADREPKLKSATQMAPPGFGLGRIHLKIRLNRLKLVQNNHNRNEGISVILKEFKVVAATAILNYYVNTAL